MAISLKETGKLVADNKTNLILHSYRRCPFAIRVRMVLEEKNLPYTVIEEKSLSHPSAELLRVSPEGKVPVLLHQNFVLPESAIITEYLEETFPEPSLAPDSAKSKAEMRLWTTWCHHQFKPDLDLYKYKLDQLEPMDQEALLARVRSHIEKIENQLRPGKFLLENKFSLADIHVFPFFRQLSKARPDFMEKFTPTLAMQWLDRIQSRPSFERVMRKVEPA